MHNSDVEQIAVLAQIAADDVQVAVVADTREQGARINRFARQDRATGADAQGQQVAGFVSRSGERVGVGDRVATRRNDADADVANRETWTVLAVGRKGVELGGSVGRRRLTWAYAREHLELAYATTTYGVQGDTVAVAHVAGGTHTSASSAYVGMTRGRDRNVAHMVADSVEEARRQWIQVFSRDRADLGPTHAAQRATEDIERYGPRRHVRRTRRPPATGMDGLTYRPNAPTEAPGIGL